LKIGIGVLTYKRRNESSVCVSSIVKNCTYDYLVVSNDEYNNVGVAGNSNRLIKNLYDSECDFFLILNNDIELLGDISKLYINAYIKTGIEFFSFRTSPKIPGFERERFNKNGVDIIVSSVIGGALMFFTRDVVDKLGYMDLKFGKFWREHTDYTKRANLAGFMGRQYPIETNIDVVESEKIIKFQNVETTLTKPELDKWAVTAEKHFREKWLPTFKGNLYEPYAESFDYKL